MNQIWCGDALTELKLIPDDTIDSIVTDPPYGYSFMNKDWDKVVVSVDIWKECLRVMKAGAFAFIMCAPRQDVLSRQIVNLQIAGFETGFTSIYWTYASGFPKAANVGKLVDKRNGRTQETYQPFADYLKQKRTEKKLSMKQIDDILETNTAYSWWEGRLAGIQLPSKHYYLKLKEILDLDDRFDELIERAEAEREIIGKERCGLNAIMGGLQNKITTDGSYDITKPATDQAKALDGSYAGFNPKPSVEIILVVMKPLSEKSYVDQALTNGHGVTWLDSCRIPYQNESDVQQLIKDTGRVEGRRMLLPERGWNQNKMIINEYELNQSGRFPANLLVSDDVLNDDSGSFSRYFSLDKWFETTFPFAIIPKPSKREKNMGLDKWIPKRVNDGRKTEIDNPFQRGETPRLNVHPTVKPLKLMCYLIALGSREKDMILDPFCGSGTTLTAAHFLNRNYMGIDINPDYIEIAKSRLDPLLKQERLVLV